MASIKFEEQVKKTLEQRKITPSLDSWDTLAKELDNHEKKNNKNSKYEVVILKDGKRINKKKKRRKSKNRLFKRKMY